MILKAREELLKEVKDCNLVEELGFMDTPQTQVEARNGYLTYDPTSVPEKIITDDLATLEAINDQVFAIRKISFAILMNVYCRI